MAIKQKQNKCSQPKASSRCHTTKDIQTVQPFPSSGSLADNLGVPFPLLVSEIEKIEAKAYSYVLSTVRFDHRSTSFEQHGSALNYPGGVLTLCTCKHQMRATQPADDWKGGGIEGPWFLRPLYRDCPSSLRS